MQQPTPESISVGNPLQLLYNVSEIFLSIQGEGTRIGRPCTFVRMQGCKLRCVWCDTPYALDHRHIEHQLSGQQIIDRVEALHCKFIEFTGGEPLEQPGVFSLMSALCDKDYEVVVETGGHVDISLVDPRVFRIVDIKCPDSKMMTLNRYQNISCLNSNDEVKFVIGSVHDYEWAKEMIEEFDLHSKAGAILMSCAYGILPYNVLAEWILKDNLNVRFQPQLHKFIWEPDRRGV